MQIIFLGLLYKLTQHQMKTESQGPDLIITYQQNVLQIYQWEDTLRNKKAILTLLKLQGRLFVSFFRCSSSNISFNLTHGINTAGIRPTAPSFSIKNLLYVCQMKCPDRCPEEPVRPLVERGTGEREKRKRRCWSLLISLYWSSELHVLEKSW